MRSLDVQRETADLVGAMLRRQGRNDEAVDLLEEAYEELLVMQKRVRKDEYLGRIAGYWEVYDNYREWTRLYEANKDQISDPNLIYPGQVFLIPRGRPNQNMVQEGETLARIAGYPEIYGSRGQWESVGRSGGTPARSGSTNRRAEVG